ncbi:hypothetical protein FOL47_009370 [Perkinsus chesapeaki]|uniref:Deoxyuridine 5'-triphosphate nucleotidohydrolase n=1 Tax=Perkinsus chesapeaki TaxID=330153 RepID=A0A7J6MRW1_PERCH|nr:hypothetical protein FOL47_009370 [Perkinsus chesapeaki]
MHLKILALDNKAAEYYTAHKTFHDGDSGLDLFVVKDQTIQPVGLSWLLLARSSISKTPLRLSNSIGLIDQGYRGEVIAAVDNIKNEAYTVKEGDRLVQAVGFDGKGITMELVTELDKTTRGEGGFGSTNEQQPSKTEAAKQDDSLKRFNGDFHNVRLWFAYSLAGSSYKAFQSCGGGPFGCLKASTRMSVDEDLAC